MRGEIWWADVDGPQPVVLLSGERTCEIRAMFIVEPARTDIEGVGVELPVGHDEGLPDARVVRVVALRGGRIACNWLVTLREKDLMRRVGMLSAKKLEELARMMKLAELE